MKRYLKYLLLVFVLLFGFKTEIKAIEFSSDHSRGTCYDDNFEWVPLDSNGGCPATGGDVPRDYLKTYSDGSGLAYCANRDSSFAGGPGNSYEEDKTYLSDNSCFYLDSSNNRQQGNCSQIVGYVLAAGNQFDGTQVEKWYWAQVSLWSYLADYSTNYARDNGSASGRSESNSTINSIIRKAFNNYVSASASGVRTDSNVNFSVSASSNSFHYVPGGSACSAGNYVTDPVTITNNEKVRISVKVGADSGSITICETGGSCYSQTDGLSKTLAPGASFQVYLKTTRILSPSSVNLVVGASYGESQKSSVTVYSSRRYIKNDVSGYQDVMVLESGNASQTSQVSHVAEKKVAFRQIAITHYTCPATGSNGSNGSGTNTSSTPVSKVCANNSNNVNDSSTYTASFSGCKCMAVSLGNNRKVNVLLKENTVFKFGNLVSSIVYAGGGFQFANAGDGITTAYSSKVTWEYADYADGVPYYYNPSGSSNANEVASIIQQKIEEQLDDSVAFEFSTNDSNESTATSVTYLLNLDLDSSYDENQKLFSFQSDSITMKNAYFSSDGKVGYEKNNTYFIDGGNRYYVPMRYEGTSFPFDINTVNLSVADGIEFWYKADCDVGVEDKFLNIRYRSIDVDTPFPKATSKADVAENWQEWYCGESSSCSASNSNKQRLKDTYQNYPTSPLYSITLDSKKLTSVNSINQSSLYTSWSSIDKNGSSSFVNDLFDIKSGSSSYCKIGEFSSSCDK